VLLFAVGAEGRGITFAVTLPKFVQLVAGSVTCTVYVVVEVGFADVVLKSD
jgi:hypothetical protein